MKAKDSVLSSFSNINFDVFNQIPGAWSCKNKDFVIIYANQEYSKFVGASHPSEIIGKTDFDMPHDTVNCAGLFRAQDVKVMETRKSIRILDIHPYTSLKLNAYIVTKSPLQDIEGEIIGTILHAENINSLNYFEIGTLLANLSTTIQNDRFYDQLNFSLNYTANSIKLTKRQSEVLFFLLRGKTVKQIAQILDISFRTIDQYLKELRLKFNVDTKYELIDKAILHGFLSTIPESLFNWHLSVELK